MSLTPLEMEVLGKLLAGEHPVLRALRDQLPRLTVRARRNTGVGIFTDFDVAAEAAAAPARHRRVGDVEARLRGLQHGAGFVLFVDEGRISMLEAFTYDEPWPDEVELLSLELLEPGRSSFFAELSRGMG